MKVAGPASPNRPAVDADAFDQELYRERGRYGRLGRIRVGTAMEAPRTPRCHELRNRNRISRAPQSPALPVLLLARFDAFQRGRGRETAALSLSQKRSLRRAHFPL